MADRVASQKSTSAAGRGLAGSLPPRWAQMIIENFRNKLEKSVSRDTTLNTPALTIPAKEASNMAMKRILAALLLLTLAAPAVAGIDEGVAAFDRGDYATALQELRPLAEQGLARAEHQLGLMYFNGQGVPQNHTEAVKWYRKAAEQGYAKAQTYLGGMYGDGLGVPQDYVLSHLWANLAAAAGGGERASDIRDLIAKQMTPDQIAEAQRLARQWTAAFEKRKKK